MGLTGKNASIGYNHDILSGLRLVQSCRLRRERSVERLNHIFERHSKARAVKRNYIKRFGSIGDD